MKHIAESLIIALAAVFAPIEGVLITAGGLIAADFLLGVLAARKRKEAISSAGFRRTITKMFVYELAVAFGYLGEHYLLQAIPVTKLISGVIALTELKSILESLDELNGSPIFASVLAKLASANDSKPKSE